MKAPKWFVQFFTYDDNCRVSWAGVKQQFFRGDLAVVPYRHIFFTILLCLLIFVFGVWLGLRNNTSVNDFEVASKACRQDELLTRFDLIQNAVTGKYLWKLNYRCFN